MRLVAPRRYGKTTLLRRLLGDCEQAGTNTVYVDFFGVVSFEEVALRIEEAYRSLRHPFANAVLAGCARFDRVSGCARGWLLADLLFAAGSPREGAATRPPDRGNSRPTGA
jgi:uncharacterized protein